MVEKNQYTFFSFLLSISYKKTERKKREIKSLQIENETQKCISKE